MLNYQRVEIRIAANYAMGHELYHELFDEKR